ncbi:extracellular solute-binding protein [Magnetovibrio blakemorei]|uniref:Iron ABC transporter substrate-binding protein n=1 Tax=Magnetovibrio blakemorei TaxID=28181 RepID=A0A1E5QAH9_9PROT|nr:extracellular solute-binding protein [Magnetovibrio blakemorei]OEJ68724.1 iron ABC transporter substrate-binding protein [Magnetovibrio blakemorei]
MFQSVSTNRKPILLLSLLSIATALPLLLSPALGHAEDNVLNVYSYRQAFLIEPLLKAYEVKTGTKVQAVFANKGLLQRLQAEGQNSPADVVLTADVNQIAEFQDENLLQSITSPTLMTNIPPQYRDPGNMWTGLTMRARAIYAHKERVKPGEVTTYEDLAKPHMKGRVCTRSGKHPYNVSLLASMIAAKGEAAAQAWAEGVKSNLARRPQGNDRAQVKAIKEGECDVSLGNSYYFGKMLTNDKKPEEKEWAASVNIIFPNQDDRGTHVNVSAAAITKSAPHYDEAVKFLEFLSSDEAQAMYAAADFEYPLKDGVAVDPLVASWGTFKADDRNLSDIVAQHGNASKMMDTVGFDH